MNKNLVIVILVVVILLGAGGFWYYIRSNSVSTSTSTTTACAPAKGETAYSGKVVYVKNGQYGQYTLQSADGTILYYLNTTAPDQEASLKARVGKNTQVNGTLVRPDEPRSTDVNIKTVCQ